MRSLDRDRAVLTPRAIRLRLFASLAALGCGGAAAVVVALLLRSTFSSTVAPAAPAAAAPAAPTQPPAPSRVPKPPHGFPAPPNHAVVFSREAGDEVLALAIVPHGPSALLQVSILNGQGGGARGRGVAVGLDGAHRRAAPCGAGCYRATVAEGAHPRVATVVERGSGRTVIWHVALPRRWPPPGATALINAATSTWESLRSLAFTDRLASDPEHAVSSTWRVAAPDRAAYVIPGGAAGIVIGDERWDRTTPRGAWTKSPQTPIHQPLPFWTSVTDAHVLRRITFRGRRADVVSFFDPGTPAWFQVVVDPSSKHTLDMHMNTTAHFMHETYYDFNSAPPIRPPR